VHSHLVETIAEENNSTFSGIRSISIKTQDPHSAKSRLPNRVNHDSTGAKLALYFSTTGSKTFHLSRLSFDQISSMS
jgi:hypothetical protein